MTIILAAMLASAPVLPFVDRDWLDQQASIEAQGSSGGTGNKTVRIAAASKPVNLLGQIQPKAAGSKKPVGARDLLTSDASAISSVCSAAATLPEPGKFYASLGSAFALSRNEVASLRRSCAVYHIGRQDALR